MLTTLQNLITKGSFTGISVTVRPLSASELSVVLVAQAQPFKADSHHKDDQQIDAFYQLRSTLVTPQIFNGTPDQIEAKLGEFVDAAGDSIQVASESLSAIAKAAKLDAAITAAQASADKSDKPKAATTKTPTTKQSDTEPQKNNSVNDTENGSDTEKTEVVAPASQQNKPAPQTSVGMFDEIDSI